MNQREGQKQRMAMKEMYMKQMKQKQTGSSGLSRPRKQVLDVKVEDEAGFVKLPLLLPPPPPPKDDIGCRDADCGKCRVCLLTKKSAGCDKRRLSESVKERKRIMKEMKKSQ